MNPFKETLFCIKDWIHEKVKCLPRIAGDRAQQPQVKHDKRKPAKPRVDRYLGELVQLVYNDNLKWVVDHSYLASITMDSISVFIV